MKFIQIVRTYQKTVLSNSRQLTNNTKFKKYVSAKDKIKKIIDINNIIRLYFKDIPTHTILAIRTKHHKDKLN